MKIRTRLQIMTAASAVLVVILAFILYWSQQSLMTATEADGLVGEIIISVFERSMLRSDYLRNDNMRAKDQWLSKQNQINDLTKKALSQFDSAVGNKIIRSMLSDNDESTVIFKQIIANRESLSNGLLPQAKAGEIESRLLGQLLLKTYDTIADARNLQEASNDVIASTQRTAVWVFFSFIFSAVFLVIIVTLSLGRIIGKGIKNLQQGAAAIGEGKLLHKIPLVGKDEFAEVAGAFNTMSGKLAETHAALEQKIDEQRQSADKITHLNHDLNLTVSQLQGANQELEAFAYSVSHDLRAPLRAMGGFSEALLEDFGDKLEGEARDYLDEIIIGSRHMGQLIDGLLTLSRSTRGELHRDRVDLSEMADRIRKELEMSEPQRRVEWRVEPGLIAQGDARMIEVVMRNLLGNAWKYTAGSPEPIIRIYAELDGNERLFCVADNGAGFDMAHSEKLFQPFQRLHRQDEFPGIGVGLATVQRIVHRHGGTITATGEPHRGATFRFSLQNVEEQSMEA